MTSFLSYRKSKSPINETTVPEHLQHISGSWDHHSAISNETREKMNTAMGGPGKSFTTFPLVGSSNSDADADVAEHLTNHGYQIKDYGKGIATTKKMVGNPEKGIPLREKMVDEKIGSILDKTKASDDVKKSFMNDPARTASSFTPSGGTHHVVITHGALGISGASTGTAWANQSCMDQGRSTGFNHKLADDSIHGTHMAFLVPHDDHTAFKYGEPSKPIARIAIKPFHEDEDNHDSDTIFRPENKMYGSGSSSFERAVGNWTVKNYPAKSGTEYTKNTAVYDDTGNTRYKAISKEDVQKSIDNFAPIVHSNGAALDNDTIEHALSYGKKKIDSVNDDRDGYNAKDYVKSIFVKNMTRIGNLNTQHVSALHKIASDLTDNTLSILGAEHGDKFSTNAIKKHIDAFGANNIPNRMLMNSKLPESVVDQLPVSKYTSVRRSLLKPHHYDKVVDSYMNNEYGSSSTLNVHAQHLTKDHLDALSTMTKKNMYGNDIPANIPYDTIISNKHFSQEHHDNLVNSLSGHYPDTSSKNRDIRQVLTKSKFATINDAEKLDKLKSDGSGDKLYKTLSSLSENPHISTDTQKHIKDTFVKSASLGTEKEHGGVYDVHGFSRGSIPTTISKHMTPEDHKTLASSGKDVQFESPEHSEKHLNAIKHLVTSADDELSNHIDVKTKHHEDNGLDEYDHTDGQDPHADHLVKKLNSHIENYARAIDNHIDLHVADKSNYDEHTKDFNQHDVVDHHLDHIDSLKNYKTDNNSHYVDGKEHYEDNVADIRDRMDKIKMNDENREHNGLYGENDWD